MDYDLFIFKPLYKSAKGYITFVNMLWNDIFTLKTYSNSVVHHWDDHHSDHRRPERTENVRPFGRDGRGRVWPWMFSGLDPPGVWLRFLGGRFGERGTWGAGNFFGHPKFDNKPFGRSDFQRKDKNSRWWQLNFFFVGIFTLNFGEMIQFDYPPWN